MRKIIHCLTFLLVFLFIGTISCQKDKSELLKTPISAKEIRMSIERINDAISEGSFNSITASKEYKGLKLNDIDWSSFKQISKEEFHLNLTGETKRTLQVLPLHLRSLSEL